MTGTGGRFYKSSALLFGFFKIEKNFRGLYEPVEPGPASASG
jgi:hypothetical protein